MSVLKRLTTTLWSRVDHAVGQIENHDAVIDAALRDTRRNSARAKVRLARVRSDGERLRTKLTTLREAEIHWRERARAIADEDENTALECLRRRRECQRQTSELESMLARHAEVERRLSTDIQSLENRLNTIAQQRNLMRTRQSTAEALRLLNTLDDSANIDIDDTFDRWEIRITETEMEAGQPDQTDAVERQFLETEDREALRAELRGLISTQEE